MTRWSERFVALVALAAVASLEDSVEAQGVKGGSSSFSSNFVNQQQQQQQIPVSNNQLSESFVQMFNTLTPVQQRQFINQMSSSNRKVFQQSIQPSTSSFFNEEVSSSSGVGAPTGSLSTSSVNNFNTAGTKSIKGSSQQQFLSPAQQAASFTKQQRVQSSFVQPTIQPTSSFSFLRQVTQSEQQPIIVPQTQTNEFQTQRVVQQVVQPQPQQQQSYFNQVQRVQQVAQPVVLPSSEQSFRRVQSFSSQPLVVPQSDVSSGFTSQQIVQQIQPQPTKGVSSSSFNRQIQVTQPVIASTGFSSLSSSSNLAGSGGFDSPSPNGFGASGALQQEKLDIGAISGQTASANSFENQQQQLVQSTSGGFVPVTGGASSFDSSQLSSGFDSSDAQQKNLLGAGRADDLYGGLTAASINNRWYIMKPVERPSELGLGDARAASGTIRQVPLARVLAASNRSALGGQSGASRSASASVENSATTNQTTVATSSPKKRATEDEKKKGTDLASDSSPLLEPDSTNEAADESRRRRRRR